MRDTNGNKATLSRREAMEYTGWTNHTIDAAIANGKLRVVRVGPAKKGARVYIVRASLERLLEGEAVKSEATR